MKLLIIGQSVEDHFIIDSKEVVKPGGIFYSAALMQNFKEENDEVYLLTAVSNHNFHLFEKVYNNYDNNYFQFVDKIPEVNLTFCMNQERKEKYRNISQNLEVKINNLNHFDGIYINMITGFDITLEQLKEIRQNFSGLIYIDIHTFSRGLDENMNRKFRKIPQFNEWAECLDIIQVNQPELLTLSDSKEEKLIAKEVLNTGVKFLIVTKEEKGAELFYLDENEVNSIYEKGINVEVKNRIGCGDVFGVVYFYTYIKTKNAGKALDTANKAAGIFTSYKNTDELKNLKRDVTTRFN